MAEQISFGSWLKQRRLAMGISQDELAEGIDCSLSTLRKLETDDRRPSGQIAQLLAEFFGLRPDERAAFVTFARTGHAELVDDAADASDPAARAPWRGAHLRQTNLPARLTPLIGREKQETAARDHLLQTRNRLLTLVGPPGIGKTRLALQVAADLIDFFEDGVYFVDLAPITDPDQVLPAIARALRLKEDRIRGSERVVLDYVRERRMLLLLDNFEQVLDAATAAVQMLEASPWLKLLVTSREALHVRGERRFALPPLGLPDLAQLPSLPTLAGYPAVELFIERAQAVAADFALTAANAAAVAALCVGLEGLPLAIELAAARADYLSVEQMSAALGSQLVLLTGGSRDSPARQRTLKSAIDWSYSLLDAAEQACFRRLGVFVGGFNEAAATALYAGLGADAAPLPAILHSLVDKSLLKQEGAADEQRLVMLEAMREYARAQLDQHGETAAVQRSHAAVYLDLAERLTPLLDLPEEATWLRPLTLEYDNLIAALEWLYSQGRKRPGGELFALFLRLVVVLPTLWQARGQYSEWRAWLTVALEIVSGSAWQAAVAAADADRRRSLLSLAASAFHRAGSVLLWQGDYPQARRYLEQAVTIRGDTGEKERLIYALHMLALATAEMGEHATARTLYERNLALQHELGSAVMLGLTLNNLALVYRSEGQADKARALFEECVALNRARGDRAGMAMALDNLGLLAIDQGDFVAARRYQDECLPIFRELGDKRDIAEALSFVGMRAVEEGDLTLARAIYLESLNLFNALGVKLGLAKCLSGLGTLAALQGRPLDAARLWAVSEAIRVDLSAPLPAVSLPRYQAHVTAARANADPAAFTAAWAAGEALSIEDAVAYALRTHA